MMYAASLEQYKTTLSEAMLAYETRFVLLK